MKTPILLVDNDRWSRFPYVVFEGDQIIGTLVPDEWVDEKWTVSDDGDLTRDAVAAEIESEFFAENSAVDEYSAEHHILRSGNSYYRYDDDGMCTFLGQERPAELN